MLACAAILQAFPEGYEAMGWRKYKSGKCSYKGHHHDCPGKHHHHRREEDWDNVYGEHPCFVVDRSVDTVSLEAGLCSHD